MDSAQQVTPILTGENTDAQVYEQGITYDSAGITYDNIGIAYGGVYNTNEDIIPIVSLAETVTPNIFGYSDIYTNITPPPPNDYESIGPGFFLYLTQQNGV